MSTIDMVCERKGKTLLKSEYKRICLVGDSFGLEKLLSVIPDDLVACILCASNRPQYHKDIKSLAKKLGIPSFIQPGYRTKEYENFVASFKEVCPDFLICSSYSMILRPDVLDIVNRNAVNVHASLLPANRGPNPVQWAIIKGEMETGITIHYIDDSLDSGDIISQVKVPIEFEDTWFTLMKKITQTIPGFLASELPGILANKNSRAPQDESSSSVNRRLGPESPLIDFSAMDDLRIYNLIRAQVAPLGGAFIEKNGQRKYFKNFVPFNEIKFLREKYG